MPLLRDPLEISSNSQNQLTRLRFDRAIRRRQNNCCGEVMLVSKTVAARQKLRGWLLLVSLALFPVTMSYFSPYIIIDSSAHGIINGSFVLFGLLGISSVILGRAWCGWLCPAGAIGDRWRAVTDRRTRGGWWKILKWVIWLPWIGLIAFLAVRGGGYHTVNILRFTWHGISVASLEMIVMFVGVVGIISILSLTTGRRGFCHYSCWMAPFMILGMRLQRILGLPGLHLESHAESCIHCGLCTKGCPMSLDVHEMVQEERIESSDCILCGTCVDTCPKQVIDYAWLRRHKRA